jgi:hypothetical protein
VGNYPPIAYVGNSQCSNQGGTDTCAAGGGGLKCCTCVPAPAAREPLLYDSA